MPLSDREQQILSEIESQLAQEDPRFARAVGTARPRDPSRRPLRLAVAGLVVGLVMLFGIVAHIAWGIVGFTLMLISAITLGNHLVRLGGGRTGGVGGQLKGGMSRYLDSRRKDQD